MKLNKIFALFMLISAKSTFAPVPSPLYFTEREFTKICSALITSYLIHTADSIRTYDKKAGTYLTSDKAYMAIALATLIFTIQNDTKDESELKSNPHPSSSSHYSSEASYSSSQNSNSNSKAWDHTNTNDLKKIAKNLLCSSFGSLVALIIPPANHLYYSYYKN